MAFHHNLKTPMNQPRQRHLFVIGFARSGTSLLYSFLNLHPEIKLIFEADLLSNSLVAISSLTGRKWWERLDFYNSSFRRHKLEAQPSWESIRFSKQAAMELYRQYAGPNPRYIGEKSPTYYNRLHKLARQFPDARFLMIWRNPYNVVSSIVSAGKKDYFFSNDSLPLRAVIGFEQMQKDVLALRARNIPVFDLCYEDLVEDPERHLKEICKFLELPFDPRMLELDHADSSMFPPGEHHAKVKSGLLNRVDRSGRPSGNHIYDIIPHYLARWKAVFGDQLSSRRYWREAAKVSMPTPLEIFGHRVRYNLARFYSELFTPFVYGLFPLDMLRQYRTWRERAFKPGGASIHGGRSGVRYSLSISVITPSYKQLPWLKLCAASVADQQGVTIQHIIQDAQTGPELDDWVRKNTHAQLHIECDSGMYDAINRGFARATGDIVCWLNSDEQYLEGTLAKVAHYFETHPHIDILFGDALLISNTGAVLSYRRMIPPNLEHILAAHLNTLSCATFFRRSVLDRGFKLNTQWRAIADAVLVADLLKAGIPMGIMNEPLAAFTITDSNLGQTSLAKGETLRWRTETRHNNMFSRLSLTLRHRLIKLIYGAYWPRSVATYLYSLQSPQKRILCEARHVDFRWYNSERNLIKAS